MCRLTYTSHAPLTSSRVGKERHCMQSNFILFLIYLINLINKLIYKLILFTSIMILTTA